jgi:hypothetical protein
MLPPDRKSTMWTHSWRTLDEIQPETEAVNLKVKFRDWMVMMEVQLEAKIGT